MSGVTWAEYRSGGRSFVACEFDADEARVIATALERDGLTREAADWRESADEVDKANESTR